MWIPVGAAHPFEALQLLISVEFIVVFVFLLFLFLLLRLFFASGS